MMKSASLTLLSSLALALAADAATHAVLPGKSIQAKIDLAVAGDIVAIFGGTYHTKSQTKSRVSACIVGWRR